MLRVGLVGLGDAGKHHARALAAVAADGAVAWTAIVARDPAKEAAFRAELGVGTETRSFATLEALLDGEACDAVILATPDGLHADQATLVASKGVHVLVEKPLALSVADGGRVLAAARTANVHVQVGYQLRHHAGHRAVHDRLAELVGTVRAVDVRWAWPDPATTGWRARGQDARFWALAALGTHGIDLAMWLGGAIATRVAAITEPAGEIDRAAEVSMTLVNGALAHVSVAVTHRAHPRVLVAGDLGEVEMLGTLGARGTGEIRHRALRRAPVEIGFSPKDPYAEQLRSFAGRAAAGYGEDPVNLANLSVLDRVSPGP